MKTEFLCSIFGILFITGSVTCDHCPLGGQQLTNVFCGLGGTRCPDGYYCEISPIDAYAVCCPKPVQTSLCGNHKQPLTDGHGNNFYCGRGGSRCPPNYHCIIAPNDAYAVCCPN